MRTIIHVTGQTHDLAAITTLTIYLAFQPLIAMSLATGLCAVASAMIGGVAPDIDKPTAHMWRHIPAGSIVGRIVNPLLGNHRMISHSLLGLALAGWALHYVLMYINTFLLVDMNIIWWSFMFGYASHLIMDSLTKVGVPWFFPIPNRLAFAPERIFRVATGGVVELFLVYPGLILLNGYLVYSHYGKFIEFFTKFLKW